MRVLAISVAYAACLLLAGCEGPNLPKSWRITYARVLATRAEVIGEEARATPEPGEAVRLRVLIVSGEPIERVSYALRVCPSGSPNGQLPRCTGELIAAEESAIESEARFDHELTVELDVPDEESLDGAPLLLVQGTICTDGEARLSAELAARCAGGDTEPMTWVAHVVVARSEDEHNDNPSFASDSIELDGDVWRPGPAAAFGDAAAPDEDAGASDDAGASEADAGAAMSVPADGKEHRITITLADSGRETAEGGSEELLLSHFVTAGKLERRFSVLERGAADDLPLNVKWHSPPAERAPSRMVAAFVMRDQRGGIAYTLRALELE